MQKFQSTLPRGERLPTQLHRTQHDRFQSTLPRGERPSRLLVTAIEQNFNPRSREGSDPRYVDVIVDRWISIHAPARGATHLPKTLFRFGAFQSTLPRGERHGQRRWAAACKNFNPRSREGSDSDGELVDLLKEISIHAPARGATHVATNLTNGAKISIHAPARGATIYTGGLAKVTLFQSTLPRGERRGVTVSNPQVINFNPRSREGSDTTRNFKFFCFYISIHAPARGATIRDCDISREHVAFQSTLPRGERR